MQNILFKQKVICSGMNAINNVIPIFDFRVYIHVEIPRLGVMIHTKSFIDGFESEIFQG